MHPYIELLGLKIPSYAVMMYMAAAAAIALLLCRTKRAKLPMKESGYLMLMVLCGAFSGAVLLHAITKLPFVIEKWDFFSRHIDLMIPTLFNGLVFYGGLIGAVVFYFFYCRAYKVDFLLYADLFTPSIPLMHAVGRVGCFFGGCCYGMEMPGGVSFPHSPAFASDDPARLVERLPVQLIESAINILIFLALLYLGTRKWKKGSLFFVYLMMYGTVRFVLEFFRGDLVRGILFSLSISQWISIAIIGASVAALIIINKPKQKIM